MNLSVDLPTDAGTSLRLLSPLSGTAPGEQAFNPETFGSVYVGVGGGGGGSSHFNTHPQEACEDGLNRLWCYISIL